LSGATGSTGDQQMHAFIPQDFTGKPAEKFDHRLWRKMRNQLKKYLNEFQNLDQCENKVQM
jgi:hypothetical protein